MNSITINARRVLLCLGIMSVTALAAGAPARADFGVVTAGGSAADLDGNRVSQAGSHPDLTTSFSFRTRINDEGYPVTDGDLKDIEIALPPGVLGNPRAVPYCEPNVLAQQFSGLCEAETQIGSVAVALSGGAPAQAFPLVNLRPSRGQPARFGFSVQGVVVTVVPTIRTGGDYGVTAVSRGTSQSLQIISVKAQLWGVPSDPSHDALRWDKGMPGPLPSAAPRKALVVLPTSCSGSPLTTTITASSWQVPDVFSSVSFSSDFDGFAMITDGCEHLSFAPAVSMKPSISAPDAPTGLDAEITSPQNLDNPDGLANAQLRDTTVTLAPGLTINPGSAEGLQACSDAQLGLANALPATCPLAAKIGTVSATTPLLDEALEGGVYLRTQNSVDPESGEMFRVALVLKSEERGILVKLAGSLTADDETGRLTATFKDNPQVPVDHIKLQFKDGPRAPLATPASCGTKTIDAELVSWAGHDLTLPTSFGVDCAPGLGGFSPSVDAGTADATAGARSWFALNLRKPDGNAAVNGLTLSLPTGLLAQLRDNVGTQVGSVNAFAGPGSAPFMLPGKVFLEGPYGDAPFSLKAVVPAKAGPFDLGDVVVRQKIYVDPIDAHATIVSDPLPTIVKGVPARLQRLDVNVDKPGFIVNPTSCAAKTIGGTLGAADGQGAPINVRFQVSDCSSLSLKPGLGLTLSGKGQTTDGKHPAISAIVSQPAGQANLKKVRVSLPLSLALDPDNAASDDLCSFVEGSKSDPKCPASSVVGKATAVSPILNQPLSGPVYFTKNERKDPKSGRSIKTLPKLVIPLVGENGVKLTLTGTSAVVDDQLVTTFDNVPDAPVSSFKMDINGGKKGILVVSDADICKSTQIADQQVDGQNNKNADADVYIQTPSCPTKIISKKITAKTVVLKIGGLGAGKVTVTGRGIRKTTKSITKSTVVTITAKRTGKSTPGAFKVKFAKAKAAATR